MGKEYFEIWVVASSGGKNFIGRVMLDSIRGLWADAKNERLGPAKEEILNASVIKLNPAYDFFSPLRPVQTREGNVGYTRDPLVTPLDFIFHDVPLYIRPTSLIFFDDMHDEDRQFYETLIQQAEQQKQASRAHRAGLSVQPASSLIRLM